ncbi:MAG: hypothetical protein DMF84_01215 [Acidobacteria bacterium]|nr:MAG: hypothetical protein DMF84_01215 [Acidobacteriota bacterium]
MTHLEKLIQAHVAGATVTTITTATEKIAEEMAREILKDPTWRAEMQTLIRRHFTHTVTALRKNGGRPRRRRPRGTTR